MANERLIEAIKEKIASLTTKQFLKKNRDPRKQQRIQQRIKNLWRTIGRMNNDN